MKLSLACTESAHDLRVELGAVMREDLVRRALPAERRSVRSIARHRVERVGEGEDPGAERDPVADQPDGIAATVPAFVMRLHHPEPLTFEQRDAGQDLGAD